MPGISARDVIEALQECIGEVIDETTLSRITVTNLKTAFGQTYSLDGEDDGEGSDIPLSALKDATKILWGETVETEKDLPPIEPYTEGEMPESILVAVASNSEENLDGHFGSCLRYLIYQLSAGVVKTRWVRDPPPAPLPLQGRAS